MPISILDVAIDPVTAQQALDQIEARIDGQQKTFVATVNPEFLMMAQQDEQFRALLNQADLRLADGVGVLWAANVLEYSIKLNVPILKQLEVLVASVGLGFGTLWSKSIRYKVIPEQVTGSDLSPRLAKKAAERGWSIFLLGGTPGAAEGSAQKLTQILPQLKVAGTFGGDGSPAGDAQTVEQLNQSPAEIVLVAYGAPKQEYWIDRNLDQIPEMLAIGVGGTLEYLSGQAKRPPQWVRRLGLEWLYRLITQPWRWRRQLALPKFMFAILGRKLS